jgi:transcriptional regulator with XRE-family HTH domain
MGTLAIAGRERRSKIPTGVGPGRRRSRRRDYYGFSAEPSLWDIYVGLVSTSLAVRRDRFSKHVKRIVAHVRQTKGWTLKQLLEAADVNKPTYYRWVNGDWTADLEPSPIERFHDAAGVPVVDAWMILWPGKYGRREATPPMPIDPDFEEVMRLLNDPSTSKEDLYLIQATMDMLLSRLAPGKRRAQ